MELAEKKYKDTNIYKLYFASFFRELLFLSPVVLLFYIENGLGIKELFLFQGLFFLISILLEIPLGQFSDRISKKTTLFLSYVLFFIGLSVWFLFKGYFPILIGEVLFAISKVLFDNAKSSYLYDYLSLKNKCDEMSNKYAKLNIFLALGGTISALTGSFLYGEYGSKIVLSIMLIITFFCLILVSSLSTKKNENEKKYYKDYKEKIRDVYSFVQTIRKNKNISYYIYYSGLLTSLSIVFALSFQPLLLKVASPIFLFGIVGFFNHGVRALFSGLTCKALDLFRIKSMIKPLFFLNIISFIFIFVILFTKNIFVTILLIFLICLNIGFQLMFTIRHVSRLHFFVSSDKRGSLISVNNLFSRGTTAILLFSSRFFIDKLGFENYYFALFFIFLILGSYLVLKLNSCGEDFFKV